MKLIELLNILPDNLDISIEHDNSKTSSLVVGAKSFYWLINRDVISAKPNYLKNINIQSFNVMIH